MSEADKKLMTERIVELLNEAKDNLNALAIGLTHGEIELPDSAASYMVLRASFKALTNNIGHITNQMEGGD